MRQGAAFWEKAVHVKHKGSPYTIMFQVEENCPIYMDNYKDWIDYFVASYPSNTTTAFVVEGSLTIFNHRVAIYFSKIYNTTMDTLLWHEHNGVTTA